MKISMILMYGSKMFLLLVMGGWLFDKDMIIVSALYVVHAQFLIGSAICTCIEKNGRNHE